MSFYDQVNLLYDALAQGEIAKAREIVEAIVRKGGDKSFLQETLKTVAYAKMAVALHDEAVKSLANKKART